MQVGVGAAALLSVFAYMALLAVTVGMRSPSAAVNQTELDEDAAVEDDQAAEQEAIEQDEARYLEDAQLEELPAEAEHVGLLSDDEPEPPPQSTPKHTSAAALLDAAITAGASTVERVHKVLRFKVSTSLPQCAGQVTGDMLMAASL